MFTLQNIWDDMLSFIKREQSLLVPVALVTQGLGQAIVQLAVPMGTKAALTGSVIAALVLGTLLALYGSLAITSLALKSGHSVREALITAAVRLPWVFLVVLVLAFAFMLAVAVLIIPLVAAMLVSSHGHDMAHLNPADVQAQMQSTPVNIVLMLLAALLLWGAVKLSFFVPALIDGRQNGFSVLRQAYKLSSGQFGRLLALNFGFTVLTLVVMNSLLFTLGTMFTLVSRAIGNPSLGQLLVALLLGVVSAALGVISSVFVAKYYQRLMMPAAPGPVLG